MTGFDSKRQASLNTLDHMQYQGRPSRPEELAQPNPWREAIDAELICTHLGTADSFFTAQEALEVLISWHVAVALDPEVSSDAQALIDRGAAAVAEPLIDEMDAVASRYAHKLALDLECVLSNYIGPWYDTAMQTLSEYRMAMNRIHERESPTFMGEPDVRNRTSGGSAA